MGCPIYPHTPSPHYEIIVQLLISTRMTLKEISSLVLLYIWIVKNRTPQAILIIVIVKQINCSEIKSHIPITWFPYSQGLRNFLIKNPCSWLAELKLVPTVHQEGGLQHFQTSCHFQSQNTTWLHVPNHNNTTLQPIISMAQCPTRYCEWISTDTTS